MNTFSKEPETNEAFPVYDCNLSLLKVSEGIETGLIFFVTARNSHRLAVELSRMDDLLSAGKFHWTSQCNTDEQC